MSHGGEPKGPVVAEAVWKLSPRPTGQRRVFEYRTLTCDLRRGKLFVETTAIGTSSGQNPTLAAVLQRATRTIVRTCLKQVHSCRIARDGNCGLSHCEQRLCILIEMNLFQSKPRPLMTGIPPGMGPYEYLDASGRREAEKVRATLDEWLTRYPTESRASLMARLRDVDEVGHNSAFFELFLHELLLRRGYTILAIEPPVPEVDTRPDYLVETPHGIQFYLEAAVVSGQALTDRGALKREADLLRALEEVRHPRFQISIQDLSAPDAAFRKASVQAEVRAWLNSLDTEHPPSQAEQDSDSSPWRMKLNVSGATPLLRAWARRRDAAPREPGQDLMYYGPPVRAVVPAAAIRRRAIEKAKRYGRALDKPFYIALNSTQVIQQDVHFEDAFFGTVQYTFSLEDDSEPRPSRLGDGVLLNGSGPRAFQVSGFLCFANVTPWQLGRSQARIIENPSAARPLTLTELGLPITRVEAQELVRLEGRSVASLLDLNTEWPG